MIKVFSSLIHHCRCGWQNWSYLKNAKYFDGYYFANWLFWRFKTEHGDHSGRAVGGVSTPWGIGGGATYGTSDSVAVENKVASYQFIIHVSNQSEPIIVINLGGDDKAAFLKEALNKIKGA